jgi:hypothetical protein
MAVRTEILGRKNNEEQCADSKSGFDNTLAPRLRDCQTSRDLPKFQKISTSLDSYADEEFHFCASEVRVV